MIYLTFLIPVITCIVLFVWHRQRTVWWEYLVVFLPSVGASFLTEWAIKSVNAADTEYLGTYAVAVQHYDDWDEWVKQTCTRTVPAGKGRVRTETYDCSHRRYHPERWVAICDDGCEVEITRSEYDSHRRRWGTDERFIDMHRRYHRKDGDAQRYDWSGDWLHALTYTEPHAYENRLQASYSLYRYELPDTADARRYKLLPYPGLWHTDCFGIERRDHRPVLGANVADSIQRMYQYINGRFGRQHQFRIYILLFPGQPSAAAALQRNLWEGGNKNELSVCIGTDSTATRHTWVSTFSWCDDTSLEVYLKQELLRSDTLDLMRFSHSVVQGLDEGLWHRKNFSDFRYVEIEMTGNQYLLFVLVVLLVNVLLAVWVLKNDFNNE